MGIEQSSRMWVASQMPSLKIPGSSSLRNHQLPIASHLGVELHQPLPIHGEIFFWLDLVHTDTTISIISVHVYWTARWCPANTVCLQTSTITSGSFSTIFCNDSWAVKTEGVTGLSCLELSTPRSPILCTLASYGFLCSLPFYCKWKLFQWGLSCADLWEWR